MDIEQQRDLWEAELELEDGRTGRSRSAPDRRRRRGSGATSTAPTVASWRHATARSATSTELMTDAQGKRSAGRDRARARAALCEPKFTESLSLRWSRK